MSNNKQSSVEDLAFWKNNAEENYMTTPISVLKYITELEQHIEIIKAQLPSDEEIWEEGKLVFSEKGKTIYTHYNTVPSWSDGAKWMRDKIGGNK